MAYYDASSGELNFGAISATGVVLGNHLNAASDIFFRGATVNFTHVNVTGLYTSLTSGAGDIVFNSSNLETGVSTFQFIDTVSAETLKVPKLIVTGTGIFESNANGSSNGIASVPSFSFLANTTTGLYKNTGITTAGPCTSVSVGSIDRLLTYITKTLANTSGTATNLLQFSVVGSTISVVVEYALEFTGTLTNVGENLSNTGYIQFSLGKLGVNNTVGPITVIQTQCGVNGVLTASWAYNTGTDQLSITPTLTSLSATGVYSIAMSIVNISGGTVALV